MKKKKRKIETKQRNSIETNIKYGLRTVTWTSFFRNSRKISAVSGYSTAERMASGELLACGPSHHRLGSHHSLTASRSHYVLKNPQLSLDLSEIQGQKGNCFLQYGRHRQVDPGSRGDSRSKGAGKENLNCNWTAGSCRWHNLGGKNSRGCSPWQGEGKWHFSGFYSLELDLVLT